MPLNPLAPIWLGTIGYQDAWKLQQQLAQARCNGEIEDLVLLLEHPPVYTMGRNGQAEHLRFGQGHLVALGAEYADVDRGGSVTFHGPGQLVAYPIVKLSSLFPLPDNPEMGDVIQYLRTLEAALIETAAHFGVTAKCRPPYTGAWVGNQKLAAIGVKLSHGVTTHGVALNVTTDLSWFDHVIPCGIPDASVASLQSLGVIAEVRTVGDVFVKAMGNQFGLQLSAASDALASLATKTFASSVA